MRLIPRSKYEVMRLFCLLLLLWAAAGGFAMYKTYEAKVEAQHFLRDLGELRVGAFPFFRVAGLADKYHGVWSASLDDPPPCGGGAKKIDFMFDNHWSHWVLFAPVTIFAATINVKGNRVFDFGAEMRRFTRGGVFGAGYDFTVFTRMPLGGRGTSCPTLSSRWRALTWTATPLRDSATSLSRLT